MEGKVYQVMFKLELVFILDNRENLARSQEASLPWHHLFTSNSFRPSLISMLPALTLTPLSLPYPQSFSSMLFYSTTWKETSIIFAWKLFINLPVKHSIEPLTSYYRNLLGTYWQLSKYLHKALKHLVPSERRSCCVKQRIIKHLSLIHKGKLPSSTPLRCLNYTF